MEVAFINAVTEHDIAELDAQNDSVAMRELTLLELEFVGGGMGAVTFM